MANCVRCHANIPDGSGVLCADCIPIVELANSQTIHRYKINLVTQTDVVEFVNSITSHYPNNKIMLTDGNSVIANAHSFLGALYSTEWDNVWCESDVDVYSVIERFVD